MYDNINKNSIDEDIVCIAGETVDLCVLRTDPVSINLYTRWMNNDNIQRWLGKNNITTQLKTEKQWAEKDRELENNTWSIIEKKNRYLIGTCSCNIDRFSRNATIGICIGEESKQHKGYGIEVVKLMTQFAFEELNAHRIDVTANANNESAIACYKKAGFVECGRKHEVIYCKGHYEDIILLELLKRQWLNNELLSYKNESSSSKLKTKKEKKEPIIRDISREEDESYMNLSEMNKIIDNINIENELKAKHLGPVLGDSATITDSNNNTWENPEIGEIKEDLKEKENKKEDK